MEKPQISPGVPSKARRRPSGKAFLEPATLYGLEDAHVLNHVLGCSHGCTYPCCSFQSALRLKKVGSRKEWLEARIVADARALLGKCLDAWRPKPIRRVFMCSATDPFMYGRGDVCELSLACLADINSRGIPVTVLTKGVLPEPSAFGTHAENELGISLASLDERFRERVEPSAAPYEDRLGALRAAHDAGMRTWISLDPFPPPSQMGPLSAKWHAADLLAKADFVDFAVFGIARYGHGGSWGQWYLDEARAAEALCKEKGIGFRLTEAAAKVLSKI